MFLTKKANVQYLGYLIFKILHYFLCLFKCKQINPIDYVNILYKRSNVESLPVKHVIRQDSGGFDLK